MQKILVIGATGNIGIRVIAALSKQGIPSKAFSRAVASTTLPALSEAVPGDLLDTASLERALDGVDKVFLLWPLLVVDGAQAAVDTIARHAQRLVYLSTAGAGDAAERASNPISSVHHAIENIIERTISTWTFLRPLGFASNTLLWADQIKEGNTVSWPYGDAQRSLIHDADIAEVAVEALLNDKLMGKRLLLTGPQTLTQREQVAIIGKIVGKTLFFHEETPAAAQQNMLAWGLPPRLVDGVLAYLAGRVSNPEPVNQAIREITGCAARSFESWVSENADRFRANSS
jgi:uncharacterized protein YbjT (DUF2867 family)